MQKIRMSFFFFKKGNLKELCKRVLFPSHPPHSEKAIPHPTSLLPTPHPQSILPPSPGLHPPSYTLLQALPAKDLQWEYAAQAVGKLGP